MNFRNTYNITFYLLLIMASLSGTVLIDSCKSKNQSVPFDNYTLTGDTIADGKNIAQLHCTKCHALVPVNALVKDIWKYHTLPSMSRFFGIRSLMDGYYKTGKDTFGMSLLEWQALVTYYKKMAPDTLLPIKPPVPLVSDWAGFALKKPDAIKGNCFTTMVSFNANNHKIYTSDYVLNRLMEWDGNFKLKSSFRLPSGAVSAIFKKDSSGANNALLTCIGHIEPIDFPNGKVVNINLDKTNDESGSSTVQSELARPTQTIEGDFNKDGLTDMVVLGEGSYKGGVYLFSQNKDHSYTQTNISDKPGAVQVVTGDFNNDGWPDLMILFGTADEGLWLFTNDHKGGFTSKNLIRFPPVYGSTSFQLADIDHDGKLDLIYTCGYNYNDSRILKPYHGLYIYKNIGNWNLKQQYFYPINGCTKAIAADFDGDGDLDIITSAFFADLKNNPAEGCIYFEQDKPFSFKPHAIPVSKYGRWMSMEVADYNNDGKPDVILGNYSAGFEFQQGLKPFWAKNIPFVVLENQFKK